MRKFLIVTILTMLSLSFFSTGCDYTDANILSSNDTFTSTSQDHEHKNTQQNKGELVKKHVVTGENTCEYEDYIFYRNTNDNGNLYRYNTKDDSYIKLFDENSTAFLHSISVYDNYVYFVTCTETDTTPTLYRVHIDGGKAEHLFDNVGDDYVITEKAIYYTDYFNNAGVFALHKYTFADQKARLLNTNENTYLILKGNNLFFTNVYYLETKFDISINCLNVENDTINQIDIGDINDIHYATSSTNCEKIFFIAYYNTSKPCFAYYDIEKEKINISTEEFELFSPMSVVSDDLVYFQARKNGIWNIYQWNKGKISLYDDLDGKDTHSVETIGGKPVLFSNSNSGNEKIIGDERLNVVAQ